MEKQRILFLSGLLFLVFVFPIGAQVKLCSWNIQNFGKSKTDSSIFFMADLLRDFDVVAIVEVVAGNGGAQAVARLADELNRKGSKWDYCISDPTYPPSTKSERYAFLWKTNKIKRVGEAWLEEKYKNEIEREPYYATFNNNGKEFTVAAFHAITKSKKPETEIKYFKFLPGVYPNKTILFCGDFNIPQSHNVFNPLKAYGYQSALKNQKTTLKNECVGTTCLASEYDNVFYDTTKIKKLNAGAIEFYKTFPSLKAARKISDHLPVFMEFNFN